MEPVRRRSNRDGRGRAWALTGLGLGLGACGGGELATRWVPHDAALVRCTTAGRTRMPPVLLDLPLPKVPTGLLARQLDPMALNDMGYERDQPVCAALLRPSEPSLARARADITGLVESYQQTGARARASMGRCACDVARVAGVAELLTMCRDEPHRPSCQPRPDQLTQIQEVVSPLREALANTPVPRLHWRVAGRSDRPGWMVKRLVELLPRHTGGATVFQPGQVVPSRHNHVLIRRLLGAPGVRGVLRLDGGRAVLVIRERDDALVLDLLVFTPVDPRLVPLLPFIDEGRAEAVVDSLEPPGRRWTPRVPLNQGNLVALERTGLRAVDRLLLTMAPLAGDQAAPTDLPEAEEPLVEEVTMQAKFGAQGKVLSARLDLSPAGQQWAQSLPDLLLAPNLEVLGFPLETRPDAEGERAPKTRSLLTHGTPTATLILDGLPRMASLMRALEMAHPGSVGGRLDAWELTMPAGAVGPGGTVPPPTELRAWSERLATEPYRLKMTLDPRREVLELTLEPG